jgi:cytochrome c553
MPGAARALRLRSRPQYTAANDKNRKITREVSAVFNRLILTLCGVVGIFAAIAAPAITTSAMAADDIEAKAQACAACHGANGVPIDPKTMPIIWGQQANYLYKELHDYKSGDRKSPIMAPVVADISLADLRQLANYFAAKPWPAKQASGSAGSPPNGIAQCQPCHQQNFEGGAPAPRLAGLNYEYLAGTMKSFADGGRTNNGDMPGFMKALSDSDRDAMARYLAGL